MPTATSTDPGAESTPATGSARPGRNSSDLTTDLREVNAETRKRVNNGLDCEDQQCRAQNLRDARGRLN